MQLQNGHILVAGYDASIEDLFLINFSEDGKKAAISIIHMRGNEVPAGFVSLGRDSAIVVQQTMPSGESAAVILRLDAKGEVRKATRYRYRGGFNPFSVIPLGDQDLCIYGVTEARENRQSLAFALDSKGNAVSALAMEGSAVFQSGALLRPGLLIFVGGRPLGVKRHLAGSIVKWRPAGKNDVKALGNIKRDSPGFDYYQDVPGTIQSPDDPSFRVFDASDLQSRLISSGPLHDSIPAPPGATSSTGG